LRRRNERRARGRQFDENARLALHEIDRHDVDQSARLGFEDRADDHFDVDVIADMELVALGVECHD